MLYTNSNEIVIQPVSGSSFVGRYSDDGYWNGVDQTSTSSYVGLMHASGAINYSIVNSTSPVSKYATNGSLNVTTSDVNNGALYATIMTPTWPLSASGVTALWDFDFANNRYYYNGATVNLLDYVTVTRLHNVDNYVINSDNSVSMCQPNMPRLNASGILIEQSKSNRALYSRDLTNNVWVKTNCSAHHNQVGADGVPEAASLLVATGANATCIQTLSITSQAFVFSAFIKRVSGSGLIQMTMDNGTTWTTVSPTSSWTICEIPTQTLATFNFGFRIVTAGDSIIVDFAQHETNTQRTSPFPITSPAKSRLVDVITVNPSLFTAGASSQYVEGYDPSTSSNTTFLTLQCDASNLWQLYTSTTSRFFYYSQGVSRVLTSPANTISGNFKFMNAYGSDQAIVLNGGTPATTASIPALTGSAVSMWIGSYLGSSSSPLNSTIKRIAYWPSRVSNADMISLTS